MSSIWKWVSHRSRLNEVLGEQKGGRIEGMRTGFTSQNMTGPFPSVTRNSFRIVFFCDRPYFSCCNVAVFYKSVQPYVLLSQLFHSCVLCALVFCSHRFPGVKVQLPDVLQGFTDNMVGNVHLLTFLPFMRSFFPHTTICKHCGADDSESWQL